MQPTTPEDFKRVIEAALLAAAVPLQVSDLRRLFDPDPGSDLVSPSRAAISKISGELPFPRACSRHSSRAVGSTLSAIAILPAVLRYSRLLDAFSTTLGCEALPNYPR